jgi:hypothetical protein
MTGRSFYHKENGFLKFNPTKEGLSLSLDANLKQLLSILFAQDNNIDDKKRIRYIRYFDKYFTFDTIKDIRDDIDKIMYED